VPKTLMGGSLRSIAEGKQGGDWRQYVVSENHTGRMIRSERFKYCVYNEGTARESLVHMKNDPGELENLVSTPEYKNVLIEHRKYLEQWIEESGDGQAKAFAVGLRAEITIPLRQ